MPVTVSHAKSNTIADWNGTVTLANSTGGTTTGAASDLVRPSDWNSVHNVTLSLSASEVTSFFAVEHGITTTTAAGGMTIGVQTEAIYEPFPLHNTNSTLSAPGIGTWYFDGPYGVRKPFPAGQVINLVSNAAGFLNGAVFSAASTGSITRYQTFENKIAFYRMDTGVNYTRLSKYAESQLSILATWARSITSTATSHVQVDNAITLSFPSQFDSNGGVTYGSTSQSGSTSVGASTGASTLANNLITGAIAYVSGARMDIVPFGTTQLDPDNYWVAHMFTSTSSSTGTNYSAGTMLSTHSRLGLLENAVNAYKLIGRSASSSTTNVQPFHGYHTVTSSVGHQYVAETDIRGTTGRMYFLINASTY